MMNKERKIAVIGTGKTGGTVVDLLGNRAIPFDETNPATVDSLKEADAAIIFVPSDAASGVLDVLLEAAIPSVWGTTGFKWPADLPDRVKTSGVPWVIGSNFSLGIHVVRKAIESLGKGAGLLDDPQLHIHEVHHTEKKDAPSGTALSWREWLGKEASISSDRVGDVKGRHELTIKSGSEAITLSHEAYNRKIFAEGAIWTANHLLEHPNIASGLYRFEDLFDQAYGQED
jgi:4-hydroxy-tetrahydrodipicolinate reductase